MPKEENLHHGAKDRPEHYGKEGATLHSDPAIAKVGMSAPANWVEKDPVSGFKTYPKRNQGDDEDCVDYAYAKAESVEIQNREGVWRELSPHSLYCMTCEPGGGSNSVSAGQTFVQYGMTLESLFQSDGITEAQAESPAGYAMDAKQVALVYKPPQVIQLTSNDFETIASILQYYQQQGKNKIVMVTLYGVNNGSWYTTTPIPPASLPDANGNDSNGMQVWFHKVAVTDFGLINGAKVLAFDNSWGENVVENGVTYPIGNNGQQFLTENYASFVYGGLYLQDPA